MKKKKQMVQLDLWGNKTVKKKGKKFTAWDFERELVVRMRNEAKIRKENTK